VNETSVTMVGNVASEIRTNRTREGHTVSSFRLACTSRRFTRTRGWVDGDTTFVTVVCWRHLAEHVASSFGKGEPVIVVGRLRVREWTADDGRSGKDVEVEAQTAGHDLGRGTSAFVRSVRPAVQPAGAGDAVTPGTQEAPAAA
jgi:single-strand DNA-binding protein